MATVYGSSSDLVEVTLGFPNPSCVHTASITIDPRHKSVLTLLVWLPTLSVDKCCSLILICCIPACIFHAISNSLRT
jgi:hypothetical protein